MIIGIGSDITNISRFERSIAAYGERLITRALGKEEQEELKKKNFVSKQEYAASVARIYLKDIQTIHNKEGRPEILLSGGARERLQKISEKEQVNIQLTISDDYPLAQAFVVIETY